MEKTKLMLSIFSLFSAILLQAQTVTLTPLSVNGQSTSTGPINLGTNSTDVAVGISVQIQMPTSPSDNNPGYINVFYRRNTSYPLNIAIGGNGGTLLFLGGTTTVRDFMITLQSSQFDNSGGFIYAEYETSAGIKYKSSNISVIKSSSTTPNNPSGNPPSAPSPYTEYVPYGGSPILSKLPNSTIDVSYDWVKSTNYYIDTHDADNVYTQVPYGYTRPMTNSINLYLKQKYNDGTSLFDLNTKFFINVNMPYYQNQTNPFIFYKSIIVNNEIGTDQFIPFGGIPNTIIGQPGTITQGGSIVIPATNYQWQKRIVRPLPEYYNYLTYIATYGWQDIPGATQSNYSPGITTEVTEYRRLIIQPNISPRRSATSNIVTIYPMSTFGTDGVSGKNLNTICCNQTVSVTSSNMYYTLDPIIGSAFNQSSYTYLWQKEILSRDGTYYYWQNIPNTNTKDYTPSGNRSQIGRKYRRIVINNNDFKHYFSNEMNITYTIARYSNLESSYENIKIYPNPSTSFLTIEGIDISRCIIKISDMAGRIILSHQPGYYNDTSNIDITLLPVGIYNLMIESKERSISKKIIRN